MTKKNLFLIAFTLVLAGVYIVYFTDWLRAPRIQISSTSRPQRQRLGNPRLQAVFDSSAPVTFFFQRELKITQLKVLSIAEMETNKYALPLWHMVSESNSIPVKFLTYGLPLRGMHAANKGQEAKPLVPGAAYRFYVEAGELKGQHDFKVNPKMPGHP